MKRFEETQPSQVQARPLVLRRIESRLMLSPALKRLCRGRASQLSCSVSPPQPCPSLRPLQDTHFTFRPCSSPFNSTCATRNPHAGASEREPFRILFCGSDEFSISSLRALVDRKNRDQSLIESIDVVCRPPKKVGRGLRNFREVPIKKTATELSLKVHDIDTFTGWTPPHADRGPFNLIVAVSFGLFIPPRILSSAKYGGLNVHPSLLPDLRGPAPIQWSIVRGVDEIGVTIQTLSLHGFDEGRILSQSKFKVPDVLKAANFPCTAETSGLLFCRYRDVLGPLGAASLERIVEKIHAADGDVEQRLEGIANDDASFEGGTEGDSRALGGLNHAKKVTPNDRLIDWAKWTWNDVKNTHLAIGGLWDDGDVYATCTGNRQEMKRVRFESLEPISVRAMFDGVSDDGAVTRNRGGWIHLLRRTPDGKYEPLLTVSRVSKDSDPRLLVHDDEWQSCRATDVVLGITTVDDTLLCISQCTVESQKKGQGQEQLKRLLLEFARKSSAGRDT